MVPPEDRAADPWPSDASAGDGITTLTAVGPVEALERIAYLLEAQRAETYKVRAFRKAADVVREIDPAELERLSRNSRLSSLSGVGDTTARVVAEALTGRGAGLPCTAAHRGPSATRRRAGGLRRLLKGDCHGHSDWSDGGSPIRTMAEAARDLGHEYWSLTDHSARLTVAHGLDASG